MGFRNAQPFLLSRTVAFASSYDEPNSIGWGLTGAFGIVFLGLAIAPGSYYHTNHRFVTTICDTLVCFIYAKTMYVIREKPHPFSKHSPDLLLRSWLNSPQHNFYREIADSLPLLNPPVFGEQ